MLPPSTQQYGRVCTLAVFATDSFLAEEDGLDLSQFRIKFSIKRSNSLTPNTADIRVYNLSSVTANQIKQNFKRVILQAGYVGNFGVIFKGNIKQVIIGRESATDTFIDLIAGDGDRAYNYAILNESIAKGSDQLAQVSAALKSMKSKGITAGYMELNSNQKLPRGKVMYGNTIDVLRNVSLNTDQDFSIQDEKLQFVPLTSFLPGQTVVLNSSTGLIGTPEQTDQGVNMKCLLNPLLKIGGQVQINNASIQGLKINLDVQNAKQISNSIPAPINADGVYFIFVAEHSGDTRGSPWYTNLVTLSIKVTTNPLNSISKGN